MMVGVSLLAADTDEEARRLFTSTLQKFAWLTRGAPKGTLPPLDAELSSFWSPTASAARSRRRWSRRSSAGRRRCATKLASLVERAGADEVIVASDAYDFDARVRSYEVLAEAWGLQGVSRSDSSPSATVVAVNSTTS